MVEEDDDQVEDEWKKTTKTIFRIIFHLCLIDLNTKFIYLFKRNYYYSETVVVGA